MCLCPNHVLFQLIGSHSLFFQTQLLLQLLPATIGHQDLLETTQLIQLDRQGSQRASHFQEFPYLHACPSHLEIQYLLHGHRFRLSIERQHLEIFDPFQCWDTSQNVSGRLPLQPDQGLQWWTLLALPTHWSNDRASHL